MIEPRRVVGLDQVGMPSTVLLIIRIALRALADATQAALLTL